MKFTAITENHLYSKAYRNGQRYVGRYATVFVLRDRAARRLMLAHPQKIYTNRIGLTVTKKVGGAVVRSRVRRILREGYRSVRDGLKTGYLIVISARPQASTVKSTDIAKDLRYVFGKLDMYEKNGQRADKEIQK